MAAASTAGGEVSATTYWREVAETDASTRHVYAMMNLETGRFLTRRQSACISHGGLAVVITLIPTLSIGKCKDDQKDSESGRASSNM